MLVGVRHNVAKLPADCGGQLACASCMVDVADLARSGGRAGLDEGDMIEDALGERPPGRRLSCQIQVTAALDGLEVRLPEKAGVSEARALGIRTARSCGGSLRPGRRGVRKVGTAAGSRPPRPSHPTRPCSRGCAAASPAASRRPCSAATAARW